MTRLGRRDLGTLLGAVVVAALGATTCTEGTGPDDEPSVARVELEAPVDTLRSLGETARLVARLLDAEGRPVARAPAWRSTRPEVLGVSPDGTVTALANGVADVVATAGEAADTVRLVVRQVVAAIVLEGADTVFTLGVRSRVRVAVTDALGAAYALEPPSWSSDDPSVASVEPGLVLPKTSGTARITVSAGGVQGTHTLTVLPLIPLEVPAALAEAFQWTVQDSADANAVFGSAAAVYVPGLGTWRGVVGHSEGDVLIRPDMLFYPGSIAKTITSAAVLALVDDGSLSLDDTVGDLLQPFENPNIPADVTLRQLLQNTSGIGSYVSHPDLVDSMFADPDRVWTPREVMERFVPAPDFVPGASWKSSNTGYVLAGMMAEASSGLPIATLLRERVYDALGMDDAATASYETPTSPVAAGWVGQPGGPLRSAAPYMTPSVHTVLWPQPMVGAESLLRFGRGLFGDFLGGATRSEMLRAVPDDGAIPNQVGGGLGVRAYDFLGRRQWGHSGTQAVGSGFLVWDEASGVVIALLYNQNGASHRSSHFRLVPALLAIALDAMAAGG